MLRKVITFLFCLVALFGECANIEMELCESCLSAPVSRMEGKSKKHWKYIGQGVPMTLISHEGRYTKVLLDNDTCFIHSDAICYSKNADIAALKGWMNPGEDKGFWNGGSYLSTDRIMEMLPEFTILGRKDSWAEKAFWAAVCCLLLGGAIVMITKFLGRPIRCGTFLFWIVFICSIGASVSEFFYLLTSADPLGFCDINNHGFLSAIFRIGLCGVALYLQLMLFSTVLFVTQHDLDFDFHGGLGPKLMLLSTLYFIVYVVAFHFFGERLPVWLNLCFAGLNLIPIAVMFYRAFVNMNFKPLLLLVPYYLIAGTAILLIYCLVGISVAVIAFIILLIMFFMSGQDPMYVKQNGIWYYCDYDIWFEGFQAGEWEDWSSNFSTWMVK